MKICMLECVHGIKYQVLLYLGMYGEHGPILGAYSSAKVYVCQHRDKFKQDVACSCFFEGVPHHTSTRAEGRSTAIKGHSVYLNLPASARQMFPNRSFISRLRKTYL